MDTHNRLLLNRTGGGMATSTGDERWMMDDGWRQAAAVKLAPERPVPLVCLCPCQAPRFWFLIATYLLLQLQSSGRSPSRFSSRLEAPGVGEVSIHPSIHQTDSTVQSVSTMLAQYLLRNPYTKFSRAWHGTG